MSEAVFNRQFGIQHFEVTAGEVGIQKRIRQYDGFIAEGAVQIGESDPIAANELLFYDGDFKRADANGENTTPAVCLALEPAEEDGDIIKVLFCGYAFNIAWEWTPGQPIYLSETAGEMTQVKPASYQVVGVALSADEIFFNPVPVAFTDPA